MSKKQNHRGHHVDTSEKHGNYFWTEMHFLEKSQITKILGVHIFMICVICNQQINVGRNKAFKAPPMKHEPNFFFRN